MGRITDIYKLEDLMFEVVESLYKAIEIKNLDRYRLALATLEMLNNEYNSLYGNYFIYQIRMLDYYRNQWERF